MRNWRPEYVDLVRRLPAIVVAAKIGDTGRPEDDTLSKVAIVAFGRYAPQDEWGWDHLQELRRWLAAEFDEESLSDYTEVEGARYQLLAAAWLGTILALFHVGAVTEGEALAGEALLFGFVLGDADRVLETPLE